MSSPQDPTPPPPAGARWLPLVAAVQLAVALAAGDMLVNLYHRPPGLEQPAYALFPAIAFALGSALVFLLLRLALAWCGLRDQLRARAGLLPLALVTAAALMGIQWAEAAPYLYARLLNYFLLGGLFCAALGHIALRRTSLIRASGRRLLIGATALAWLSTLLHLAGWFFLDELEARWGLETFRRRERALNALGGATIFLFLSVLGVHLGAALEARSRRLLAIGDFLAPAAWIVLAFALFRWRSAYGHRNEFPDFVSLLTLAFWLVPLIAFALALARAARLAFLLPLALALGMLLAGVAERTAPGFYASRFRPWKADPEAVRRIIFVTSDTLRSDVLELYGGREIATPHLTDFAADALVFDEAVSAASWTLPAFAGMFTGLNPGVFDEIGVRWRMSPEILSLPERLADAGYFTGAVGMNPLLRPRHGLDQGFSTYDFFPRDARPRTLGARWFSLLFPDRFRTDRSSEDLKNLAIDWIDRHRDKDFFLWLHFWDPHTPLGPPPPFRPGGEAPSSVAEPWERSMDIKNGDYVPPQEERDWIWRLYLGEVRYVDAMFGDLLRHLKTAGLYDDALIVFASDHGEEFWDHGDFGHGQSLFHELIHVPLVLKLPGQARTGRIPRPVSTVSLAPTLLDFARVGYDPLEFSVPSLAPLCLDPSADIPTLPIYSETAPEAYARHRWGVRFDDYQYLRAREAESREELYHLPADPRQLEDLHADRPEPLNNGRGHLRRYHEENHSLRLRHRVESLDSLDLNAEDLEHLRKLGYI